MRLLDTRTAKPEELALYLDKPLLQDNPEIEEAVRRIISDVRQRGDTAVLEYVRKFDWPGADSLVVSQEMISHAYSQVSESLLSAIKHAARKIEEFHSKQTRLSWTEKDDRGALLGQLVRPVDRAAVLAPGFQAPLPSSVLMGAIPARVAGVKEIYLCTPPRKDGTIHPAVAVAAAECGVERIYKIGGAHGVAALAYGTQTVPKVDKIVGPGNVYVTMAKRLVFGQVGIDMLAGPSEVLIVADETATPKYLAADLLSQAEHDSDARAILLTPSLDLAERVSAEIESQIAKLSRADVARASLERNGAIIITSGLEEAFELANRVAPEHLELMIANPLAAVDKVKNAGAILVGEWSTEPVGDYTAGPNHILPTSGTARFSSPLSVEDFLKKSSLVCYSEVALRVDASATIELAETEGLDAHANAVRVRLNAYE